MNWEVELGFELELRAEAFRFQGLSNPAASQEGNVTEGDVTLRPLNILKCINYIPMTIKYISIT
ncbi:MAG: hypothetical protein WCB90_11425 [Methanosarcina sp.]